MLNYNPELVAQLTELGLGQQEAIDCLRASNNDVDKAADLYFSGGLAEWQRNNTWDEGAFHRDRYDEPLEPLTGWGPQNINVNNPPRTSTRSAEFSHLSLPMKRYLEMQDSPQMGAPSDIGGEDHQHLLGGGFGDDDNMFGHDSERATAYSSSHSNVDYSIQGPDVLTPEVLGGPPRTRPSSPMNPELDADTNRSDADIARAVHMSINSNYNPNDYSGWGNQETGITGTHSTPTAPTFGPATRPNYDPSQWALTTIPVAHEIYLDPAHPSDRQRKEGEPAFFKPSSDGFHLGPALAIFHSIPAAREALLASQHAIEDYGYNERWWSGEKIEGPRITNIVDNEGTEEVVAEPEPSEVVLEVQRLMAFLDKTMRGYGSVDSLAKVPEVYEQLQGGQIASFFKKWSADIKELSNLEGSGEPKPFTSTAIPNDPFHKKDFQVLTVHVSNELVNTPGSTIYSAIDQVFWTDQEEVTGDVYLDPVADVFCISITRDPSELHGIGLDIPADLYLDRYTAQFVDVVREMKSQRENISNEIRGLEKREERLLHCRNSNFVMNTSTVETTKLLDAAIEHFEHLELPSNEDKDEGGDVAMDAQEQKPKEFLSMSTQLKGMLDRLKVRLEELAGAKEKAKKTLHKLTTAFTSPETTPESAPPLRKHSLRGVFIDLSTTFIKVQRETEERATIDEWWCLSYPLQWEANANTAAYKVMKATEREVLDAAKYTGDGKVLLVYATDEAMQPRKSDGKLPEALKIFVERDNVGFLQELESAGDKGKRKRSNWWDHNTHNNTSGPRISVEDHSSMIENGGAGVHQPPASPTGFIDAAGSPVPSSSGPPQKKSSTGEWPALGAQEGFTGEAPEDHGSPRTADRDNAWARGEPTGRGWERMNVGSQMESDGDGGERRYVGNFVATHFTAQMPEDMGFARIGEDDEEMRDAQHVEYMAGNGEWGSSSGAGAAGDAAWRVFMDESKAK